MRRAGVAEPPWARARDEIGPFAGFRFRRRPFVAKTSRVTWFYRRVVRPILFIREAEPIHDFTLGWLGRVAGSKVLCRVAESVYGAPQLPVELFGLKFPNPVGLAAGMDKWASAVPAWAALGFGFSELGGVTWHAQPGNPLPRVFRAIADEAIVNSMGFNNPGASAFAEALLHWKQNGHWPRHPVGINLGKSKVTPLENAPEDYANSFRLLRARADFFVVNVSSPNTPGLRRLQDKSSLEEILAALRQNNQEARPVPLLVKVAPDLAFEALDEILELTGPDKFAGIVATNTTVARPEASTAGLKEVYARPGGLSGRPLRERSTDVIRHLYRQTRGALPIIGVGGIFNAEDAWEKITAGASLVQIYTSLVYRGPGVVKDIVSGLRQRMKAAGLTELRQAVGQSDGKLV